MILLNLSLIGNATRQFYKKTQLCSVPFALIAGMATRHITLMFKLLSLDQVVNE